MDHDDKLMKLIDLLAFHEGVKLTDKHERLLKDCSKHFLEAFNEAEADMHSNSDFSTNLLQGDSKESPSDSEDSYQSACKERRRILNLLKHPPKQKSYEHEGSPESVKDKQFSLGYPLPDYYPLEELEPRLIRRIKMQKPHLPLLVMNCIRRKPRVLWFIMRKIAYETYDEVRKSLKSKNIIRNLFWKASLAATFGCYDAFFIFKHAALRCTRKDLESTLLLYMVASNLILRKLMLDADKKRRREKLLIREARSEKEVIPLCLRKYYRSKKKICKVKASWVHYLFRNRSLIKKPCRVINAKLKQSITELAFSNHKNRYPIKHIPPALIARKLVLYDYDDGLFDCDYGFTNLLSDNDNLYLREDVSRILKRSKMQKSDNLEKNHKIHPNRKGLANKLNPRDITQCRISNFFRLVPEGFLKMIVEYHVAEGNMRDWIDEVKLPLLIEEIENKDKKDKTIASKRSNDSITVQNEFEEMVYSVLSKDLETDKGTFVSFDEFVNSDEYCGFFRCTIPKLDSSKLRDSQLFQEIRERYLDLLKEEENEINMLVRYYPPREQTTMPVHQATTVDHASPSTSFQNQAMTENYACLPISSQNQTTAEDYASPSTSFHNQSTTMDYAVPSTSTQN